MGERPEEIVARGYDRVAEAYGRLEGDVPWPRMRWLQRLFDGLPAGSRVLDLGCGSGLPATKEIAARHDAVGVDVSERQIELARKHVPGARFLLADALSLELPPASFDAVVAFYVLDHIPRERYGEFFRNISEWLRPGGWFLFTAETEDHPGEVSEWLGVSMFFNSLDPKDIRRLVTEAGFEAVRSEIESQIEGEKRVPYLWVLTRKVS